MPRPPADPRRTTPSADPGRIRAALQRSPAPPVSRTKTPAARARPGDRCDRPDQAQASRPRPDQRIPKSSLTITETPAQNPCTSFGAAQARTEDTSSFRDLAFGYYITGRFAAPNRLGRRAEPHAPRDRAIDQGHPDPGPASFTAERGNGATSSEVPASTQRTVEAVHEACSCP